MKKKNNSGFTLLEILITSAIMIVALVSTLGLFGYLLSAAGGNRSFAIAQYEAERKMEEIGAMDYATAKATYTPTGALTAMPFDITSNLAGVVYAQELETDGLMRVKVVVCYRDKNRVIGEDANLNGTLDVTAYQTGCVTGYGGYGTTCVTTSVTEDANNNGEIDSPCQIESVLANKKI